jgi:hypothetical protein
MARSFLAAKFQSFSLMYRLVSEREDLAALLKESTVTIIYAMMTEEVYLSCLEDSFFSRDTKIRIADDLIQLWDSGTDPRMVHHMPFLRELWTARNEESPVFGTMDGTSELMRITMDMGKEWQGFISSTLGSDDPEGAQMREALEEFLFGLSYEEILSVRERLARFGISAVSGDEVRTYLGDKPSYELATAKDFRVIYDFFVDRRDTAHFRKRAGLPGPTQTIEEIYLKYLIARE